MANSTKRSKGKVRVPKGDPGVEFMSMLEDVLRAAVGDGHISPGQSLAVLLAAVRGVEHMLDVGFGPEGVHDLGSAHALVNSMPTELLADVTSNAVRGILNIPGRHAPKKVRKTRRKVRR